MRIVSREHIAAKHYMPCYDVRCILLNHLNISYQLKTFVYSYFHSKLKLSFWFTWDMLRFKFFTLKLLPTLQNTYWVIVLNIWYLSTTTEECVIALLLDHIYFHVKRMYLFHVLILSFQSKTLSTSATYILGNHS